LSLGDFVAIGAGAGSREQALELGHIIDDFGSLKGVVRLQI